MTESLGPAHCLDRVRSFSGVGALWLLTVVAVAPLSARAQTDEPAVAVREDDDPSSRDRARALFREGVRLTDELQWSDALEAFRGSYRIRPAPAALLNIGIALRSLGRYVEAEEALSRYLRLYRGRNPEHDALAMRYVAEAGARIAQLSVRTRPAAVELTIDGRPVRGERDGDVTVLRVDPGEHFIGARARGYAPVRRAITLVPNSDEAIVLTLQRIETPDEGGPSGWIFVGIGAGVAAAAGAVVAAILLTAEEGRYPQTTYAAAGR
ncbi:MAG: PEGA domain-containing protein [Deltaproteobacteria bacterium]|nr:PEGA domain-containing protein [Deltaproteobacteria bacterium]